MTTPEVPIGAKVQVAAGVGIVKWTGSNPKFSAGKWVGIALEGATGKNDGTVQGEKYFDCKPNHGVFVRPSQVKVLEAPRPVAARTPSARPPTTPNSRVTSANPVSRVASPQKPPNRAVPSTPPRTISQTPSQNVSPPTASSRKPSAGASSMGPPGPGIVFKRPPSVATNTPATVARAPTPSSSVAGLQLEATTSRTVSPAPIISRVASPVPVLPVSGAQVAPIRSLSSAFSPSLRPTASPSLPSTSRPTSPDREAPAGVFTQKRELEEMRIKVRLLQSRRSEDQERIGSLEKAAGEADALRAARVKLQAKFQEIQSSLIAAQRLSRDLQSENAHLETRATEALDQLEMAALDREVAEERAEAAEAEVVKIGERISEMELEVAVLKEENAEYEKPTLGGQGERTSLAYVQLEKHNERLKEALIRLRDVSAEADKDHKAKVADLEKELSSQGDAFARLGLADAKLANAEAQVDDLKQQLDDALGAEDMLEQLTDRNLQMSERIEEMRVIIEDLEALKDLNDELEEQHIAAEKQLSGEIDGLSGRLRDETQRATESNNMVIDMETTIGQFRELVANLESEIDSLREEHASQESVNVTASREAQALMNLNLKLQTSAVKTQSKTVELDMKRLEAAQLAEHMRIVTAYLPDPYHETEASSTNMLLFFRRISAKVDMIVNIISQIHGLPSALYSGTSETLVGTCELRGKLRHFATLNKRFAAILSRSTPEDWLAYGKLTTEVGGVENKVDGWINSIKGDEFHERDCARELGSLIAQFDHLAERTLYRPELDRGEVQLGLAYSFDHDLDNFAAAVGFARQAVLGLADEGDVEVIVEESSMEEGVYEPVQQILDLVRGVKVPSGKLVAQVGELVQGNIALLPEIARGLSDLATSVSNAVDLAVQLAQRIGQHTASIRASKNPLRLFDIETFLEEVTEESSAVSDAPPWELIGMFITRLGNDLNAFLPKLKTAVKGGHTISLDIPPPWLARVTAIKEAAAFNADTERKVLRLSEELKDVLREVKIRDQSLQEAGVKVETLERRLETTRKQADTIMELENDVAKVKKQEKVYTEAIEQMQAEQDALEAENAKLRKGHGVDHQANASSSSAFATEPIAPGSGGLESSHLVEQVENLRSAIRWLRHENAMLKSKDFFNDLQALPALTTYRSEQPVPELDPSSSPSSPSSSSAQSEYLITPTKHALETESKLLFREVAAFQSRHGIVDISQAGVGVGWKSKKQSPEMQVWEWKNQARALESRFRRAKEAAAQLQAVKRGPML